MELLQFFILLSVVLSAVIPGCCPVLSRKRWFLKRHTMTLYCCCILSKKDVFDDTLKAELGNVEHSMRIPPSLCVIMSQYPMVLLYKFK